MNHQAIVETVFKAVIAALPNELGALLGQELSCSETQCRLIPKDALFGAEPRPKSTIAHLKVSGDHAGEAYLVLSTKTSIIFGGTLIMLPKDQIEEHIHNEVFKGEVADAYGEVANILAGVLTQVFLDKYPKNVRFVRTEVGELIETKLDPTADKPFPPGAYFHLSTTLNMGEQELGRLEVITPAELLDLQLEASEAPAIAPQTSASAPQQPEPQQSAQQQPAPAAQTEKAPPRPSLVDAKKVADVVLKATLEQVAEEVGALLGQKFTTSDLKLETVTKEEFFSRYCLEKSALVRMDVSGARSGHGYLLNQIKDAILMGGTLIMLPDEEIEDHIAKGLFEGEVADAYGEVANIIAGGLTQTFKDRYSHPLRFIKTTAEQVVPTKVVPADDSPFPDGLYYLASCSINLQGNPLERLHLLFPAEILGLDSSSPEQTAVPAEAEAAAPPLPSRQAEPPAAAPQPPPATTPIILVIADSQSDAEAVSKNLSDDNYEVRVIGFKDDLRQIFATHRVLGIFLLMSEVGEKGFSVAIKLQSAGQPLPPVIAGGPEWTRSSVLKAVKYGARDILVTPATDEEIREKVQQHIHALA